MATRGPEREDPTHPSEIPTALIEEDPFLDDEGTAVEDVTTAEDRSVAGDPEDTPTLRKFRRPTRSEIAQAVDQVNTEAVSVEELARARAAQDEDIEEE